MRNALCWKNVEFRPELSSKPNWWPKRCLVIGGGGPLPGPLCVWRDMYLSGMGDHFQVPKVSEGICTVLRTHLPTAQWSWSSHGWLIGAAEGAKTKRNRADPSVLTRQRYRCLLGQKPNRRINQEEKRPEGSESVVCMWKIHSKLALVSSSHRTCIYIYIYIYALLPSRAHPT